VKPKKRPSISAEEMTIKNRGDFNGVLSSPRGGTILSEEFLVKGGTRWRYMKEDTPKKPDLAEGDQLVQFEVKKSV